MKAPRLKNLLSRRPVKYAFAAIAVLLIGVAGWWMAGRKVWTDGLPGPNAIRIFTADEDPRQVLWTPSRAVLPADFDPGVGTDAQVYEPAISPDGTELFFVRGKAGLPVGEVAADGQPLTTGADIYVSRRKNNRWLPPERLDAVSGLYDDLGPRMTADGRYLLFYSNRPGGQGGYDLWAAARDDDGNFDPPANLGPGVNSEFDEYGPAPSADGRKLYFSTNRTAASKEQHTAWRATIRAATSTDFDLWSADLTEVKVAAKESSTDETATGEAAVLLPPPVLRGRVGEGVAAEGRDPFDPITEIAPATKPILPQIQTARSSTQPARPPRSTLQATAAAEVPGVNTPFHEGAPCITPAGDFLYFASNRPEGHGKFDLYRIRFIQGELTEPENLGPSVNTADNETDPQLAHGGFKLYYSSDRVKQVEQSRDAVATDPAPTDGSPREAGSEEADKTHGRLSVGVQTTLRDSVDSAAPSKPAYTLFETDSREVYPERQGRPLPVIGWKLLAMIAGALLLLPLLFFLARHINRRNLTLLQRCFVAALCIYALFLFWTTSKHVVMEAIQPLAADLGFVEVKINLDPKIEESNVAMAIRQQSSNDLPVAAAPAGQLTQQAPGGDVIEGIPDVAVNVPQAAVGGDAMTVAVAPKIDLPKADAPAVSMVSPVVAPTPQAVDVKIDVGPRLQQAEAAPAIQPPNAPSVSPAVVLPQPMQPAPVAMPDLPAAQPDISVGTLASNIGPVAPNVPQVAPTQAPVAPAAMTADGAAPAIDVPAPAGAKAIASEPATAKIEAQIAPAIRTAAVTPAAPSPAATAMQPVLPKSIADAVSLSDASAPSAQAMPVPAPASGTVQVRPAQSQVSGVGVAANAPSPAAQKVAGVDPSIPAAASAPGAAAAERIAAATTGDASPVAGVQTKVPAAGAMTGGSADSLAAAPGVGAQRTPEATAAVAGVAPNLPAGELVRNPEVAGPQMNTTPISGGGAQTPTIASNQAVGLSRQNTPVGELAGGAGAKNDLLPRLPTAGGGTPSMAGNLGPSDAASAIARMNGPQAGVSPSPASTSVATSAGVGGIQVQQPATRPTAVEPSLADAVAGGATDAMQPATRPASAVAGGAPATPAAATAAAVPAAGAVDPSGASTMASVPATRPAGAAIAAANVRVTGPVVGNPAGSAAIVRGDVAVTAPVPAFRQVAAAAPQINTAPASVPGAAKVAEPSTTTGTHPGGMGVAGITTATPAAPDVQGKTGGSIAAASVVAPRNFVAQPALPAPSVAGAGLGQAIAGIDGPQTAMPKVAVMPTAGNGQGTPDGSSTLPGGGPDGGRIAAVKADGSGPAVQRPIAVAMGDLPGVGPKIGQGGVSGPVAIAGPRPGIASVPGVGISPNISVSAPKLGAPEALFQRSVEQRRPMIEKLGGTKESEDAVERGLAWLASVQEPDGRWTFISNGSNKKSKNKSQGVHDMAMTGLSVLAFLAADHSPTKEGPYQQVVASGVEWLVNQQTEDGDLRGPKPMRGAGSGRANMYDHGIATMAVAEAALMTGDRRYMDAAFRAAEFICQTQNKKTGGWRYLPGETGDTSVFGWQILALHNAELLGFQTPDETRSQAERFLSLVSSGKTKILAGYTPGQGPTPPMTAEALFCRVLLGQPISDDQAKEVVAFLGRDQPTAKNKDLYYWYYMSLSMSQLQANPQVRQAWDKWNKQCRDALIETQVREGDNAGSWTDNRWGEQGGRVYSTALATLTLEVYYRYLPLDVAAVDPAADAAVPAAPAAAAPPVKRPRGPVGPKFEPN